MNHVLRVLFLCVFSVLVFGAGATQDDPFIVPKRDSLTLTWDNVNTMPIVLGTLKILNPADVEVLEFSAVPACDAVAKTCSLLLYEHVKDLPNGLYQCVLRVEDNIGNQSPWSAPCWFDKQFRDLAPPGGCILTWR